MGRGDRIYENAIEIYLHRRQVKRGSSGQARPLPLSSPAGSASSSDPRSVWRLGWSADQCVEVKIPVFFRCTATPSSADVTSVVYARQRHPRATGLQPNDLAGLERLWHDLILANIPFVSVFAGPATGAKNRYEAL